MKNPALPQPTVVAGRFRRSKPARRWSRLFGLLLCSAFIAAALITAEWRLAAAGAALLTAALLIQLRQRRKNRVDLRLTAAGQLSITGGAYDLHLSAPFRCQTGIERIPATARRDETCFVRLVLDVYGRPLVFEEEVPAGAYPPQLAEITGLSSALGLAELRSATSYPGTLWALIQQLEAFAAPSTAPAASTAELYRSGRRQLSQQRYPLAIKTFSEIIRISPDAPLPYYQRGKARYHRSELDKALNDLTTALRLDPKLDRAYRMRALVHAERGDWARGRDDCTQAIQLRPKQAGLYNLRGSACFHLQDYDAALSDFERAISLDSTRCETYYNRGLVKEQQEHLQAALADFRHSLQLNPAQPAAQSRIAALQQRLSAP